MRARLAVIPLLLLLACLLVAGCGQTTAKVGAYRDI
jgi:predicted small secreted protein